VVSGGVKYNSSFIKSKGICEMGSDLSFVEYVTDQISEECGVSYKKMFGEYALYSNGKVVALVCDNQLL